MKLIVDALIKKQNELKLSETEFSKRLGMSRAMWFLIKKEKRTPGLNVLRKITQSFPDLQILVFQSMTEKVEK